MYKINLELKPDAPKEKIFEIEDLFFDALYYGYDVDVYYMGERGVMAITVAENEEYRAKFEECCLELYYEEGFIDCVSSWEWIDDDPDKNFDFLELHSIKMKIIEEVEKRKSDSEKVRIGCILTLNKYFLKDDISAMDLLMQEVFDNGFGFLENKSHNPCVYWYEGTLQDLDCLCRGMITLSSWYNFFDSCEISIGDDDENFDLMYFV